VFFVRRTARPLRMTLSVSVDDKELARTAFTRTFVDPGVSETSMTAADGLVGTLFRPDVAEPAPAVVVIGGSDGGRYDNAAALLASNGFAALSLAYFGVEDTPSHLHRIELRTFETVLDWLASQPGVDGDRLAVIGLSRGGELALQLASLYPQIRAVVAGAPSSVRQAGLTSSYTDFTQPAWVLDGEPLPFVPGKGGPRDFFSFVTGMIRRRPMGQVDMFRRLLHGDQDVVRRASIEVERIAGRILLVSGVDDQLWPSAEYSELIVRRLREHGRDARHLSYPDAGHFVCFPYGLPDIPPFTQLALGPTTTDFGGTPAANAAAARQSWPEILAFLADV
jgi:dienelactone hydrolase